MIEINIRLSDPITPSDCDIPTLVYAIVDIQRGDGPEGYVALAYSGPARLPMTQLIRALVGITEEFAEEYKVEQELDNEGEHNDK